MAPVLSTKCFAISAPLSLPTGLPPPHCLSLTHKNGREKEKEKEIEARAAREPGGGGGGRRGGSSASDPLGEVGLDFSSSRRLFRGFGTRRSPCFRCGGGVVSAPGGRGLAN